MTIKNMMDQFEIQGTIQVLRFNEQSGRNQTLFDGDIAYAESQIKDLRIRYMYADADPLDEPGICFEVE